MAGKTQAAPDGAQIVFEAGVLAKAMKHAAAVVESRNTIPILANVRLVADGETCELTTSNLDIEFRQRIPLAQPGQLATTCGAQRLASLASAVGGGAQIQLKLDGGRMEVRSGRSRWIIPTLPVGDFPELRADDFAGAVQVPGADLAKAIDRVAWCTSTEASKPYAQGVFFNPEAGQLRLTAVDGSAMVCAPMAVEYPAGCPEAIVPTRYLRHVEKLAEDQGGTVLMQWNERVHRCAMESVVITGKVIDQTFPDYRRVVPAACDGPATFDPAGMVAAIRRVMLVNDGTIRAVRLVRDASRIVLQLGSISGSEGYEELPADCEPAGQLTFSAPYLTGVMDAIGGDSVQMHRAPDARDDTPILVRRTVDDGAFAIIAPMKG